MNNSPSLNLINPTLSKLSPATTPKVIKVSFTLAKVRSSNFSTPAAVKNVVESIAFNVIVP